MNPKTLKQHVNYVGKLAEKADEHIAKIVAKLEEAKRDPRQELPLRERKRAVQFHKRKNLLSFTRPKKKSIKGFQKSILF